MEQLLVLAQIFYREEFPFPGELSCTGFPEKKSRNTGKLSLKHLQMLRGLHFLADTVAALLHPCAEVLWKLHQRRQKANLACFLEAQTEPRSTDIMIVSREVASSWFKIHMWYKTDFKLLSVLRICFILAANQVRAPLSAACQVLQCKRSALHSVNGQLSSETGKRAF